MILRGYFLYVCIFFTLTRVCVMTAHSLHNFFPPLGNGWCIHVDSLTGLKHWNEEECVSIVRRLDSPTLMHKIEKKMKIIYLLTLFESLCTICISMFPPLIWKKIKKIKKSHAHHKYVAYTCRTVGLSSCRTIELSD